MLSVTPSIALPFALPVTAGIAQLCRSAPLTLCNLGYAPIP